MFKSGDEVSVVNETTEGRVVEVIKDCITVEDEDGFIRVYKSSNLVIRSRSSNYELNSEHSQRLILEKINASFERSGKISISKKSVQTTNYRQETYEIDLHIEELTEDYVHMSNFEILQRQMMTCRMFIERAIYQKAKKAVIIHGKGEGVLRTEIHHYLNRLDNHKPIDVIYEEASRSYYGAGATEVNFKY